MKKEEYEFVIGVASTLYFGEQKELKISLSNEKVESFTKEIREKLAELNIDISENSKDIIIKLK